MGIGKKLLKPRVIVWGATTILLVAFMAVATVLTTKTFKGLLEGVFGSDTAITKEGEGGIAFEQEFFTKDDARENGNKVVKEICEEGMVLLKMKITPSHLNQTQKFLSLAKTPFN